MSRLDEIEGRLAAATPGPWEYNWDGEGEVFDKDVYKLVAVTRRSPQEANAVLIASAPTDLAWLVRVARAAERAIECGQSHNLEYAECSCGLDALRRALEGGGE